MPDPLLGRKARPTPGADAELLRAARLLAIRSRREARGLFAGRYQAAFRGSGMEFEESRPYVPGDDPRRMDWNATARTGEPYVKHFREERGRTVLIALDVSASMAFGSGERSKADHAAYMAALLAVAAGQAGDRVGLVAFDDTLRCELRPARGPVHAWRIVQAAGEQAQRAGGATHWSAALDSLRSNAGTRAVLFLLSDFRCLDAGAPASLVGRVAQLAERHDVVCGLIEDRRERFLPAAGRVRIADPERPGQTRLLRTSSPAVRSRYEAACRARRRGVERTLRATGASVFFAPTDRDALRTLGHFFDERAAHTHRVGS